MPRVPEEASAPTAEAIAAPAAAPTDFSQSSCFTLTAVGLQHAVVELVDHVGQIVEVIEVAQRLRRRGEDRPHGQDDCMPHA